MKIPLAKPFLTEKEKLEVCKVLDSGWLIQGPRVLEFEKSFTEYTKSKFAMATSSCTTALHMALIAAGVKQGDKIMVPSYTFIATANVVEYVGAIPVFVDIDVNTYNISTVKIEEYLTSIKTANIKFIIPVHLFGLCADIESITSIANNNGIKIIEDAACALGSYYKEKHAGTFGVAGCFSFHPRKSITTGEGGMLITDNQLISKRVQSLRNHGASKISYLRHKKGELQLPSHNMLGYNFRMNDIQAALGNEQIKKIDWITNRRISIANKYTDALKQVYYLKLPAQPNHFKHSFQSYVIQLMNRKTKSGNVDILKLNKFRNIIMMELLEKGISTRPGTTAVHYQPYYRRKYNLSAMDFPASLQAEKHTIALPLYPQMTDDEQAYVIENLLEIFKKYDT